MENNTNVDANTQGAASEVVAIPDGAPAHENLVQGPTADVAVGTPVPLSASAPNDGTVVSPDTDPVQKPKTPAFSIARIDAIILKLWQKVNDKEHALIEQVEKLLGIE